MANFLPETKLNEIPRLEAAGWSMRDIASHLGISKDTANKYVRWLRQNVVHGDCGCGRKLGHKGCCRVRREMRLARPPASPKPDDAINFMLSMNDDLARHIDDPHFRRGWEAAGLFAANVIRFHLKNKSKESPVS